MTQTQINQAAAVNSQAGGGDAIVYHYVPSGVCSRAITFSIKEGKLHDISFEGGCPGNLAAISRLLEGADACETVRILKGNLCGAKKTSCADQLALAIESVMGEGVSA